MVIVSDVEYCRNCNHQENTPEHRTTDNHRMNELLRKIQDPSHYALAELNGIKLDVYPKPVPGVTPFLFTDQPNREGTYYLDITQAKFNEIEKKIDFHCTLHNTRATPIYITYADILCNSSTYFVLNYQHEGFEITEPFSDDRVITLQPKDEFTMMVRFHLHDTAISDFNIPLGFSVRTTNLGTSEQTFSFTRFIVVAISENEVENRQETSEWAPRPSPFTECLFEKVTHVCHPQRKRLFKDLYPMPKDYHKTLAMGLMKDFGDGVLQTLLLKLVPGYVTASNYVDFFSVLLWLDEMCTLIGINCYNMEGVEVKYSYDRHRDLCYLSLEVPGLQEKRPSVVKGDLIELMVQGDHDFNGLSPVKYRGIIDVVLDTSLEIHALHPHILETIIRYPHTKLNVKFVMNRIQYERMHMGITRVVTNGYIKNLFPPDDLAGDSKLIDLTEHQLNNPRVYTNDAQMLAVRKIISESSNSVPYLVWGPPGTGKTVTIIEAIYQLKRLKNYKILVCAPANAACDMLTEKLRPFCTDDELIRVMSATCDLTFVPKTIYNYTNLDIFAGKATKARNISAAQLKDYKIVVTTLVLAGKYVGSYHPDIIFIDEAAQAREPEACIPMSLFDSSGKLVLAGDPKQLGPISNSMYCNKMKFKVSLFERLMDLPLYQRNNDNNFMTMLTKNYRSHEEILRLPNQLFYNNQLEAACPDARNDPLAKTLIYDLIQSGGHHNKNGSPIEFCSVIAREQREGRSPSYFNTREIQMVVSYVKALTSVRFPDTSKNVAQCQIGVIAPYIRQVYKTRQALNGYPDVEVGTTESFQGREKRVIIITTVRAQESLLLQDQKYKLGFVGEPKRFNVAVTRAKSKLIVIGNPLVLMRDAKWYGLILQAETLGALRGAPFPRRDPREVQILCRDLSRLLNIRAAPAEPSDNAS